MFAHPGARRAALGTRNFSFEVRTKNASPPTAVPVSPTNVTSPYKGKPGSTYRLAFFFTCFLYGDDYGSINTLCLLALVGAGTGPGMIHARTHGTERR